MLTGSLRSNGYSFGERQVDQALQSINSVASSQRKVKAGRSSNLVPTGVIKFVALGDKIWSPWIRRPKFVATGFPPIAHIQC